MTMSLAAHGRIKQAYETMANRLRNVRKEGEKAIERTAAIAFTSGTATALGYVNEMHGTAPTNDPQGYPEYSLLGVPVDMAVGGVALAATFLGAAGKYDHFVLSIGNGGLSAFGYRFGAEFARKRKAAQAAAPAAKTAGAASAWGPARGAPAYAP